MIDTKKLHARYQELVQEFADIKKTRAKINDMLKARVAKDMDVWPGVVYPFGWDDDGIVFKVMMRDKSIERNDQWLAVFVTIPHDKR